MKKISHKKVFIIAALIVVFVALPLTPQFYKGSVPQDFPTSIKGSSQSASIFSLLPFTIQKNTAFAQSTVTQAPSLPNFFSCITNPATCALYIVSWFINALASLFVSLGAWLVRLGLSFNNTVFDSPTVQIGFSVSLAIANLGFVLGIIIIAIATILQNNTYGIKKILWKLVVMAILVNFGLVITRPIVAMADSLTNYFVQSTTGTIGTDYGQFVTTITSAFAPQTFTNAPSAAQGTSNTISSYCFLALGDWLGLCNKIATVTTGTPPQTDVFWKMLLAMAFSATFICLEAVALIALAVLLFVRYVALGILLVLLPFAWLAWVFPKYSSEFAKWWTNFIKWTFFPPLAVFFIYLSLQTAALNINGKSNSYPNQIIAPTSQDPSTSPEATLMQVEPTAGDGVGVVQQAADEILLISLMIGGLFAASSLAGKAGSVVTGTAKTAVGWVGNKTWNGAKQQGRKVAAKAVPQKSIETLQKGGLTGIGRFIPKRLQVAAGIGLGNVQKAGGAALIDQESAWAKQHGANPEEAKRLLESGGISKQRQIALLQQLSSQGRLDNGVTINKESLADFADTNQEQLKTLYGQGKLVKDINKALGSNEEMRSAVKTGNTAKLNDEADKFFAELTKGDVSKSMNVDAIFGGNLNDLMAQAQLQAIAKNRQDLIPTILAKGNGKTGKNIQEPYRKILDEIVKQHTTEETEGSEQFKKRILDIQNDFDAQIDAVRANADSLDAVKSLKVEEDRAAEQLKRDRTGFNADFAAAQQKYDNAMKDISDRREKIVGAKCDELKKQGEAQIENAKADVKIAMEKRYGKQAFEQAIVNNTFGVAAENASAPAVAEPPKPNAK